MLKHDLRPLLGTCRAEKKNILMPAKLQTQEALFFPGPVQDDPLHTDLEPVWVSSSLQSRLDLDTQNLASESFGDHRRSPSGHLTTLVVLMSRPTAPWEGHWGWSVPWCPVSADSEHVIGAGNLRQTSYPVGITVPSTKALGCFIRNKVSLPSRVVCI